MKIIPLDPPLEALLQDYQHYGREVAGLAPSTCLVRLQQARSFWVSLSVQGPLVLSRLSVRQVADYLAQAAAQAQGAALAGLVTSPPRKPKPSCKLPTHALGMEGVTGCSSTCSIRPAPASPKSWRSTGRTFTSKR
jgi:hypothetical protein